MHRVVRSMAMIVVLLAASAAPAADVVVAGVSTGIDRATGLQLPNNAPDPDWTVAPGADGGSYVGQTLIARSDPLPRVYMPDAASTHSRWVVINSGAGLEGFSVPGAGYNFRTTVDLGGFDASTAVLRPAHFAVDDLLASVNINGIAAFTSPSNFQQGLDRFYDSLPPVLGAGDFHAGLNTITFDLVNIPGSPQALRFEGTVTVAQVPEPTGAWLLLTGAWGFLASRRRPRRADRMSKARSAVSES